MSYNIRYAESRDTQYIIAEIREFAAVYGTSHTLPSTDDHLIKVVTNLIDNHICLIAEKGTEQIGFIAGYLSPHFLNPEVKTLVETFWWVSREHRGSRAGIMLLIEFIQEGKHQGCHWITMSTEEHSDLSDHALIKRGFRFKEKTFVMEL